MCVPQTVTIPLRVSIKSEDQVGFYTSVRLTRSCFIILLHSAKPIEGMTVRSLGLNSRPTLTCPQAFMNTNDLQVFPSLIRSLRRGRMRMKAGYPRMADPKSSQLFN